MGCHSWSWFPQPGTGTQIPIRWHWHSREERRSWGDRRCSFCTMASWLWVREVDKDQLVEGFELNAEKLWSWVFTLEVVMRGVEVSMGSGEGIRCWRRGEPRFGEFTGSEVQRVRWFHSCPKGTTAAALSVLFPPMKRKRKTWSRRWARNWMVSITYWNPILLDDFMLCDLNVFVFSLPQNQPTNRPPLPATLLKEGIETNGAYVAL